MTEPARTTYARATAGYDAEHVISLLQALAATIFDASRVSDANCVAIRTSEATDALVKALALVLALRPESRVPSQLRKLVDDIAKRLRCSVATCRDDEEFRRMVAHWFDGGDRGGNA